MRRRVQISQAAAMDGLKVLGVCFFGVPNGSKELALYGEGYVVRIARVQGIPEQGACS